MGEPIRIADQARDPIALSGLKLGEDIEIEFTGLRPGEKLYEELFQADEAYERTRHAKIFVGRNGAGPEGAAIAVTGRKPIGTAALPEDGARFEPRLEGPVRRRPARPPRRRARSVPGAGARLRPGRGGGIPGHPHKVRGDFAN